MNASFGKGVTAPLIKTGSQDKPVAGTDYVGMWYEARRRNGVDDTMWFGFYENGDVMPVWKRRSHRFGDGIGGLVGLLRERGHDSGPLPSSRSMVKPGWREVWRTRRPVDMPPVAIQWHQLDPSQRHSQAHVPVSLVLSPDQTSQVEGAAKVAGVSSTVWLLWTADRASRTILADTGSVMSWVFPVNLRGAVQCDDPLMNHCSGLMVRLAGSTAPAALKQQISERFARNEHWRQWFSLTLGRYVGQTGINLLYRLVQAPAGRHTGSYSNLGEWNVPFLDALTCSAPGSPAYPVAVSTVLCNGRRSLACRLHPVIGGSSERAIEFLTLWRELSCTRESLSGW